MNGDPWDGGWEREERDAAADEGQDRRKGWIQGVDPEEWPETEGDAR